MNPHRTITRFAATAIVTVAYVALTAASVGCGGGDDNTVPQTTTVVAVFTPDPDTPPAAGSITLLPGTSSGGSVDVRVTVTQMASFFGAAFRIKYDATALLFDGMDDSTSFLRDGVTDPNQLSFIATVNFDGEIVITATRFFPAVPVPLVSTTDDLVILNFVARRPIAPLAPEGRLDFGDPKNACDGSVAPCGPITVTAWNGGSVSAVSAP